MSKRIFVAGHKGMVGSALVRQLSKDPNNEIVTRTRAELDLSNQQGVAELFANEKIDEVYLGAAKVGGIQETPGRMNSALQGGGAGEGDIRLKKT